MPGCVGEVRLLPERRAYNLAVGHAVNRDCIILPLSQTIPCRAEYHVPTRAPVLRANACPADRS